MGACVCVCVCVAQLMATNITKYAVVCYKRGKKQKNRFVIGALKAEPTAATSDVDTRRHMF